jgi:hypothetical protein
VKLGFGFFHVEANALVAQFSESDLLDGFTNREGYAFYAIRKLNPATELRLTLFDSDEIRSDFGANGPFVTSIRGSNRTRVLADVMFSF